MSMSTLIIVLLVVAVLLFLRRLFGGTNKAELKRVISEGAFLVDVRSASEFASGSVRGAVNIPLDQIRSRLAEFKNKQQIVVFCQSGGRSIQAQRILQKNDIPNVYNGGPWTHVDAIVRQLQSAQ